MELPIIESNNLKLESYYGNLSLYHMKHGYFLMLPSHSTECWLEIDEETYNNLKKFVDKDVFITK